MPSTRSKYISIYRSTPLHVYLSIYTPAYLSTCTYIYAPVGPIAPRFPRVFFGHSRCPPYTCITIDLHPYMCISISLYIYVYVCARYAEQLTTSPLVLWPQPLPALYVYNYRSASLYVYLYIYMYMYMYVLAMPSSLPRPPLFCGHSRSPPPFGWGSRRTVSLHIYVHKSMSGYGLRVQVDLRFRPKPCNP